MMSDRYRDLKRLRQADPHVRLPSDRHGRRARSTTRIRQPQVLRPTDNNIMRRPASADRVSRLPTGSHNDSHKYDSKRFNRENALIQVWAPPSSSREKPRYKPGQSREGEDSPAREKREDMLLKRITRSRESSRSLMSESCNSENVEHLEPHLERCNRKFDEIDRNHDGVIDRAEFLAAMRSQGASQQDPDRLSSATVGTQGLIGCACELCGHSGAVLGCAASSSGSLISGGADGTVRVWTSNQSNQKEAHRTFEAQAAITSCAVSSDGKIAAGSQDGLARVWDCSTNKLMATFRHASLQPVLSVRFWHSGSSELMSAGGDGGLRLWSARSESCIAYTHGHTGAVHAIDIDASGMVASAGDDCMVRMWKDFKSEACRSNSSCTVLEGHTAAVLCVSFSPSGRLLASGAADNAIRLFKWGSSGNAVAVLENAHASVVRNIAFSPSGKHLVSCGDDSSARVWRVASGECIAKLWGGKQRGGHSCKPHDAVFVTSAVEGPSAGVILTACDDGMLRLWDLSLVEASRRGKITPTAQPRSARREQLEFVSHQAKEARDWATEAAVNRSTSRGRSRGCTPEKVRAASSETSCGSKAGRRKKLAAVFGLMDLDGSGYIEIDELLRLGTARRTLGQKQGEWTEEKNERLLRKMYVNGDAKISRIEFAQHFEHALPTDEIQFDLTVQQFMTVARSCPQQKSPKYLLDLPVNNSPAGSLTLTRSFEVHKTSRLKTLRQLAASVSSSATYSWSSCALQFCGRLNKRWPVEPAAVAVLRQVLSEPEMPLSNKREQLVEHLNQALPAGELQFATAVEQCSRLLTAAVSKQGGEDFSSLRRQLSEGLQDRRNSLMRTSKEEHAASTQQLQQAEEQIRQCAAEDAARRRARQREAEEEARHQTIEEDAARHQTVEEDAARQQVEEDAARQHVEDAARQQTIEEDAAARQQTIEEDAARQQAVEEAARQQAAEEAARQRAAEEWRQWVLEEDAARQQATEEAARQQAEGSATEDAARQAEDAARQVAARKQQIEEDAVWGEWQGAARGTEQQMSSAVPECSASIASRELSNSVSWGCEADTSCSTTVVSELAHSSSHITQTELFKQSVTLEEEAKSSSTSHLETSYSNCVSAENQRVSATLCCDDFDPVPEEDEQQIRLKQLRLRVERLSHEIAAATKSTVGQHSWSADNSPEVSADQSSMSTESHVFDEIQAERQMCALLSLAAASSVAAIENIANTQDTVENENSPCTTESVAEGAASSSAPSQSSVDAAADTLIQGVDKHDGEKAELKLLQRKNFLWMNFSAIIVLAFLLQHLF